MTALFGLEKQIPYGNDNQKGDSRFPLGMTERKAKARATTGPSTRFDHPSDEDLSLGARLRSLRMTTVWLGSGF